MKNIEHEVFSLQNMNVVKASYKNSVYYVAGANDITEYVELAKTIQNVDGVEAINYGLDLYLREHQGDSKLAVQQFDVVILNNSHTSHDYVVHLLTDIFNKSVEEAVDITDLVHYNGSGVAGTYPYELAHTFACMIETANTHTNQNLQTDIVPSRSSTQALSVVEKLIQRDHPGEM